MAACSWTWFRKATLSERIRAGGAGIPAFFTPTGVAQWLPRAKKRVSSTVALHSERAPDRRFRLRESLEERQVGQPRLSQDGSHFNPMMATAARITIAEVEQLVEPGELDPDLVHTPSVYVKRIFPDGFFERRIEKRTVRKVVVNT